MKHLFLADTHLSDPADPIYRQVMNLLEEHTGQLRTLVLLGDIFEFWIGYRHVVFSSYVPLLEKLRQLREAGTQLVFVEGNHDFHLGPYFRDILDCRILPDGGPLELDGRRIFLTHGDLVNPHDKGYRRLRRVLRHPLTRRLLSWIPPDAAWAVARRASRLSARKGNGRQRRRIPDEALLAFARERFEEGYDTVITGHFHVPLQRCRDGQSLLALGDWSHGPSYILLEQGAFTCYPGAPSTSP